jgi:septum formation protein
MSKQLILASASPRRKELLHKHGIECEVIPSKIQEIFETTLAIPKAVEKIASDKANSIATTYPTRVVLAADTVVVCQETVLGKPKDEDDAFRMLALLSANKHQVITGVCIVSERETITFSEITTITFKELSHKEILDYIDSKEPFDKAGAYAIQGKAHEFIDMIDGDYDNVVGLPITRVMKELKKLV